MDVATTIADRASPQRRFAMDDELPRDASGNEYRENWAGQWEPTGRTKSPPESTGLLFGSPDRATSASGREVSAYDGTPLYQAEAPDAPSSGASHENRVAGGIAGAAGVGVFALVVAIASAAIMLLTGWYVPTLVGSIRRDHAERRVSITTLGYGLPVVAVVATMATMATGPGLVYAVSGILTYAVVLSFVAWVPMRFGRGLRNYDKGRGGWAVVGWLAGALVTGVMALTAAGGSARTSEFFMVIVGYLGILCFAAGLVWGLAGEPDLVRTLVRSGTSEPQRGH